MYIDPNFVDVDTWPDKGHVNDTQLHFNEDGTVELVISTYDHSKVPPDVDDAEHNAATSWDKHPKIENKSISLDEAEGFLAKILQYFEEEFAEALEDLEVADDSEEIYRSEDYITDHIEHKILEARSAMDTVRHFKDKLKEQSQ